MEELSLTYLHFLKLIKFGDIVLLGHTTFAEQPFQDARLDAIHNNSFGVTQSGLAFTIGTETVSASANVTIEETDLGVTVSVGDETAFGESFQNLISFSAGDLEFFIWSETDDSETSTWKNVEPGSTD
jgi:hypothetical protein|tara:strand:- start:423 stop:806 length:384 start_codon:yes stop_codon:yes gene_type:complete